MSRRIEEGSSREAFPLDQLPDEVIVEIYSLIPSYERESLRLLSKRHNSIIKNASNRLKREFLNVTFYQEKIDLHYGSWADLKKKEYTYKQVDSIWKYLDNTRIDLAISSQVDDQVVDKLSEMFREGRIELYGFRSMYFFYEPGVGVSTKLDRLSMAGQPELLMLRPERLKRVQALIPSSCHDLSVQFDKHIPDSNFRFEFRGAEAIRSLGVVYEKFDLEEEKVYSNQEEQGDAAVFVISFFKTRNKPLLKRLAEIKDKEKDPMRVDQVVNEEFMSNKAIFKSDAMGRGFLITWRNLEFKVTFPSE